jgi:hypothetical protein
MTDAEQREFALREADRMRMLASEDQDRDQYREVVNEFFGIALKAVEGGRSNAPTA